MIRDKLTLGENQATRMLIGMPFASMFQAGVKTAKDCILGHSGCGKSTVLSIIAGLQKATYGGVVIAGKEIKRSKSAN